MTTDQYVLFFAVKLVDADFATLSRADWMKLREELDHVLGRDKIHVRSERAGVLVDPSFSLPRPQQFKKPEFSSLQRKAKSILEDVVRGQSIGRKQYRPDIGFQTLPDKDRSVLHVQGSVQDVFVYVLLQALTRTSIHPVRRCAVCGRIFVRVRKQLYCTRRCTNAASTRAYRRTPLGKEAVQRTNRRAYEKRTKARLGQNVKIRENTRKR